MKTFIVPLILGLVLSACTAKPNDDPKGYPTGNKIGRAHV